MAVNTHLLKHYLKHLARARRKGHNVHSPYAFSLCEEVFYNEHPFYCFEEFLQLREELLRNQQIIEVDDFGAGSRKLHQKLRKISAIARFGMSSRKQNETLFRLVNFLRPVTIIELGTSLGLNTLYLAAASASARVYSIEGSPGLSAFARSLSQQRNLQNAEFLTGVFDETLPALLNKLSWVDMAYVDGNHTYEATLRYFGWLLEKCSTDSVLVFDDIYWSPGMTAAWKEISAHPRVTMSIDAFWFGLVFFRDEIKQPVQLEFLI